MSGRNGGRISMEKVREILRLSEQGLGKTEIARSCRVNRHTVRDYVLKAAAAGVTYGRLRELSEEEMRELFGKKKCGRRIKDSAIDFKKISHDLCIKGVTLQLLWEEYLRDHPEGYSYSQFCSRYKAWQKDSKISMRHDHKAGEKVYIDYCGQTVEIVRAATGEVSHAQIFVGTLGVSNYTYCEATESQELQHWIGSHVRMFEFFGGVPEIAVPDNLKSGVTSPCRYEPEINRSYQELAEHYGVAVVPARVRKPRDKAKVETAVQVVERRILAKLRNQTFYSVAELNVAIKPLLIELNERIMKGYAASRRELFEQLDKSALSPLPQDRYKLGFWKQARVSIDYHVEIERHYYSVPHELRGKKLWVRYGERTVEIFHQGKRIVAHRRSNLAGRHTTIAEHMPKKHRYQQEWNPVRLLEWAAKIGPETKIQINSILLSRQHPEQAYRSCLGLLSLAKKYSNARLECACEKANQCSIVSMRSIKTMLQTGHDRLSKDTFNPKPAQHSNVRGDTEFH